MPTLAIDNANRVQFVRFAIFLRTLERFGIIVAIKPLYVVRILNVFQKSRRYFIFNKYNNNNKQLQ